MLKMLTETAQEEHAIVPLLAKQMGIQPLPLPKDGKSVRVQKEKKVLIAYIKAN